MKNLKDMLNNMLNETLSGLEESVIKDVLCLEEEDMLEYMNNVVNYGVASGIVGDLIYIGDINDFFKENFEEIFDLYQDYKEMMNLDIEMNATNLSYFAYEVTMGNILDEVISMLEELEELED